MPIKHLMYEPKVEYRVTLFCDELPDDIKNNLIQTSDLIIKRFKKSPENIELHFMSVVAPSIEQFFSEEKNITKKYNFRLEDSDPTGLRNQCINLYDCEVMSVNLGKFSRTSDDFKKVIVEFRIDSMKVEF